MADLRYYLAAVFIFFLSPAHAEQTPFSDVHLHYNWTQKNITSISDISRALDRNNVQLAVISGTPTALAHEVSSKDKRIIALFSPYTHEGGKSDWFKDVNVLKIARSGLQDGRYKGIGEVHFMAGFKPSYDNDIARGLFQLAQEFNVPVLIHVDASSANYYLHFCQHNTKIRFLLAHAGGIFSAKQIEKIISQCPNTWVELSARDPWRYDRFLDRDRRLPKDWKNLFVKFPDRFMTGTDPVWNVTKETQWDEDDEGWEHYDQLIGFHRAWLSQLPDAVENKIRYSNAKTFFLD